MATLCAMAYAARDPKSLQAHTFIEWPPPGATIEKGCDLATVLALEHLFSDELRMGTPKS